MEAIIRRPKEQELFDRFPKLFRRVNLSIQESCMSWGIEAPDEWLVEIEKLCEQISAISDESIEFEQIKTKFGHLVIYYQYVTDSLTEMQIGDIDSLIEATESRCVDKRYLRKKQILLAAKKIQELEDQQSKIFDELVEQYFEGNHNVDFLFDYCYNNTDNIDRTLDLLEAGEEK